MWASMPRSRSASTTWRARSSSIVPSYLTRPPARPGRGHDEQVRVEVDPDEVAGSGGFYRLLNSVVIPRPIAWVSTRSVDGVDNLAPHSFFTVASVSPPIVQFTSVG